MNIFSKNRKNDIEVENIQEEYFNCLNIDSLKFILEESKLLLSDSQSAIDSIVNKSSNLFQIIILIISALISFTATYFKQLKAQDIEWLIASIFYFFVILCIIYFIIYPKKTGGIGSEPKKLINGKILDLKYEKNQNEIRLLLVSIKSKQKSLENNKSVHSTVFKLFKTVTILLLAGILFSIIFLMCRSQEYNFFQK